MNGGYRGLYSPSSKKHGFGKVLPSQTMLSPFFEKKCRTPPRMVQMGGGFPHFFFENRRQHGLGRQHLTEKVAAKGGTPFVGTFWRFWGFPVKMVCHTGLPGNPSQQRKRYTTHRGSSQRCSRGSILYSLRVQGPNRPSGGPLRWPPMSGVPFSLLNWIP